MERRMEGRREDGGGWIVSKIGIEKNRNRKREREAREDIQTDRTDKESE